MQAIEPGDGGQNRGSRPNPGLTRGRAAPQFVAVSAAVPGTVPACDTLVKYLLRIITRGPYHDVAVPINFHENERFLSP